MALCCSWVCWFCRGKDSSPTCTAKKSCSLLRQCLEMGRFHSSLLRLLLMSQEGACWPYQMRLPSQCPPQQAAGPIPNFTTGGLLWEATCREVSFSGINVLMRTTQPHFRSLCVGRPREMCTPVPPTHSSQSRGCSWSKAFCSPTVLIPYAAAEGANPAPFGENCGSAYLRWSRLTGTCRHHTENPVVRSLLLRNCVWQCSTS